TASPEEPLLVVLRELSDDEAPRVIPGMPASDGKTSLVERARQALRAGGADFYTKLGAQFDAAFPSNPTFALEPSSTAPPFDTEETTRLPRISTPSALLAPLAAPADVG